MIKKLMAATCCAAIATLAVAGCSNSDDKVKSYAKRVCDQVQPQQHAIQQATDSIGSVSAAGSSPSDVQKTDSEAFARMAAAYKALGLAVQDAGAPPVDKGATLQQNAVKQLNGVSSSYADLKKVVDDLDTGNQARFAEGLKTVSNKLAVLSKDSGNALTKLQAGDVGKAMAKQPGCQKDAPAADPA